MTTHNRLGIYLSLLLSAGSLIGSHAKAQVSDTTALKPHHTIDQIDKYKIWGASIGFFDVQDTKMSPMVYSGPSFGIEMSLLRTTPRFTNFTNFNMHYALLVGLPLSDSYMHGAAFRINSGLLYQIKPEHWKVGGSADLQTRGRIFPKIGNDAFGIDLYARINLAASYTLDFKSRRANNTLDIRAELPLFASVMRFPDYSVNSVNFLFMPAGRFKALRTKFTLIKSFKYSNENRYAFSYEWDFFTFKEYDKLFKTVSGAHILSYTYWLKTK
jgi:hypothetical protein